MTGYRYFRDPHRNLKGADYEATRDNPYRLHLCAWLEANGVNYKQVAARPGVVLAGNYIVFYEFETLRPRKKGGFARRVIRPNGTGFTARKRRVRQRVAWSEVGGISA